METSFFELEELSIAKPLKKISLDKWQILCEKEEIIAFLCEYIPFAYAPKRINNGNNKGSYRVIVEMDKIEANYRKEPFNYERNKKIFQNEVETIVKNWRSGEIYAGFINESDYKQTAELTFCFDENHKKQYIKEWNGIYSG